MIPVGSKKLILAALLMSVAVAGARQLLFLGSVRAQSDKVNRLVDRSEELYRKFMMSSEPSSLSVSKGLNCNRDGAPVSFLIVQITPDREGAAVVMTWDTESARLISVRHSDDRLTDNKWKALAPREATGITHTWLRSLVLSDQPSEWKLLAPPIHLTRYYNHSAYAVQWGSHDRAVEIIIEDHTGDLLLMQDRPLSRLIPDHTETDAMMDYDQQEE